VVYWTYYKLACATCGILNLLQTGLCHMWYIELITNLPVPHVVNLTCYKICMPCIHVVNLTYYKLSMPHVHEVNLTYYKIVCHI
jgi:hypothetical protein